MKTVAIESLIPGTIFQRSIKGKPSIAEYVAGGFNRSSRKYSFYRCDDINAFGACKRGTLVFVDDWQKTRKK